MSNNRNVNWEIDDEDEDDDFVPQNLDDSRLVRDFRKQLNAEKRKNKELQAAFESLQTTQRERIIKDVLTSKGVNTKIAKFIPADIEVSEETISGWIDSNADVFGLQQQENQQPAVNEQDIAALQRMNNVTTGALTPSLEETLASQLSAASSEEELMSILNRGQ